jgi:hypothetical protein
MRYTFKQAKDTLSRFASGYGLADIGLTVNTALDELSHLRNWQRLRKVVRLQVTSEEFGLPEDCGAIIRAAIDSQPVSIHGTDYEFLHAGPGDLDFQTPGLAPVFGIQRLGVFATMVDPTDVLPLAVLSTAAPTAKFVVKGRNGNGETIIEDDVPITTWTGPSDLASVDWASISKTTDSFALVDNITTPDDATGHLYLFSVGATSAQLLAVVHPGQQFPEFTRYRLPGFDTATADKTYRLLAEVAVRFLPLVEDDDVLPLDSLTAVQYMMQAMWNMDAGEIKAADDFRNRAELALIRREDTEGERQTLVVVNRLAEAEAQAAVSSQYSDV